MDLYQAHVQGRAARHRKRMEIEEFNENIELIDTQKEQEILTIEDTLAATLDRQSQDRRLVEIKDSIASGIGARTTLSSLAESAKKGKSVDTSVSKKVAEIAEKKGAGKVARAVSSVANTTTEVANVAEHGVAAGEEAKNIETLANAVNESSKLKAGISAVGTAGKGVMEHVGGFMNVGLGMYDLSKDFSHGHFHVAGDNDTEQLANVLQIASGALELAAFVPGVGTGVAGVGALLGVGASVLEGIGEEQEAPVDTEEATAKSQADIAKKEVELKTPPKIKQSVAERIVGGVTGKVSG
tara:strand:- start:193 stop:1086 length:894 start_codon:yes stop_codon:yes gene_type:complete